MSYSYQTYISSRNTPGWYKYKYCKYSSSSSPCSHPLTLPLKTESNPLSALCRYLNEAFWISTDCAGCCVAAGGGVGWLWIFVSIIPQSCSGKSLHTHTREADLCLASATWWWWVCYISNAHSTTAEKSLATQRIGLRPWLVQPHSLLYKPFAAELQEIPRTLAIPLAMVKI